MAAGGAGGAATGGLAAYSASHADADGAATAGGDEKASIWSTRVRAPRSRSRKVFKSPPLSFTAVARNEAPAPADSAAAMAPLTSVARDTLTEAPAGPPDSVEDETCTIGAYGMHGEFVLRDGGYYHLNTLKYTAYQPSNPNEHSNTLHNILPIQYTLLQLRRFTVVPAWASAASCLALAWSARLRRHAFTSSSELVSTPASAAAALEAACRCASAT